MYAGDEFYDDDVTSGPVDDNRDAGSRAGLNHRGNPGSRLIGTQAHGLELRDAPSASYDEDDDPPRCVACDLPIDASDHGTSVCDDCSGLRGCIDDICHGLGYCMHVKDAWRP